MLRSTVALGIALGLFASFAACSSNSDNGAVSGAVSPEAASTEDADPTTGDAGSPDAPGIVPSTVPLPSACPTAKYKTLVVVGDSISDVGGGNGGAGQLPFYRTLLVKNDDTLYPAWKGFDLATCWGLDPTTGVVKVSRGGAVATVPSPNSGTDKGILLNQVTGLPATLAGPVLVVGTIGGNDVQSGLVTVLTGTKAAQQAQIDAFVAGFGAAMAELTKPDRFGAGVKADVLMTNIYDPSGGTGHFYYAPGGATCPGALGFWPDGKATGPQLQIWNDVLVKEAARYPGVTILELAKHFETHAVSTPVGSNWFYQDCIHPDSLGHDAIRGIFWAGMVGLR